MPGDLILDGYDDLALVGTLIWPLYVLNLQGVGRAGGVIPHAVMRIVLIYIHSCSNICLFYALNLIVGSVFQGTNHLQVWSEKCE